MNRPSKQINKSRLEKLLETAKILITLLSGQVSHDSLVLYYFHRPHRGPRNLRSGGQRKKVMWSDDPTRTPTLRNGIERFWSQHLIIELEHKHEWRDTNQWLTGLPGRFFLFMNWATKSFEKRRWMKNWIAAETCYLKQNLTLNVVNEILCHDFVNENIWIDWLKKCWINVKFY